MNYQNNVHGLKKINERSSLGPTGRFDRIDMFNSINDKIMPQTIHAMHDLSPYMKTSTGSVQVKSTVLTILLSTLSFMFTKSLVSVLSKRVSFFKNLSVNTSYVVESAMYALILGIALSISIGINTIRIKKN